MTDYILTSVSVDDVLDWDPCPEYPSSRIEELWAGRERLTPLEISYLDVPAEDICWALLRPEIIPESWLHELACHLAEQFLLQERAAGREPDARCWRVIEMKRRWIRGDATDAELYDFWDAVGSAAWDAAWSAVRYSIWYSVWSAVRSTTGSAPGSAIWYAAWSAIWYAAWKSSTGSVILEMVRVMLRRISCLT